jgi:hypothetical protein
MWFMNLSRNRWFVSLIALILSILSAWLGYKLLNSLIFPPTTHRQTVSVPAENLAPGMSVRGTITIEASPGSIVTEADFILTGDDVGEWTTSFNANSATLNYTIEAHPVIAMDRTLDGVFLALERNSWFKISVRLWLITVTVLTLALLWWLPFSLPGRLNKEPDTTMEKLRLNGPEISKLEQLICEAFLPADFSRLLNYRLNRKLANLSSPGDNFPEAVGKVLERANTELWWTDLLREIRNARPSDPSFVAFAEDVRQGPNTVDASKSNNPVVTGRDLELRVRATRTSFDIMAWRTRLGEIESRVCRIEYPEKQARGTGFLVGPNLVMTNYHVVAAIRHMVGDVEHGNLDASSVVFRFDFKVLPDGLSVTPGKTYKLADHWLVAFSPASALDVQVDPSDEPRETELDFAILRVGGEPGKDPVGGDTSDPDAVPRGWIQLSKEEYDFSANPALYIVQHPDGAPMKVAIDSDAIMSMNSAKTRVRYRTETEPGSSGSPCFGADWDWVAIHQSGDPKYWKEGARPRYNQGIPVNAIRRLLKERGQGDLLV